MKIKFLSGEEREVALGPYANLSGADLSGANLSYANLSCANLSYADLYDANLSYANLSYANLYDANLSYANLTEATLPGFQIPAKGAKICGVWKKLCDGVLAELTVPARADRTASLIGRKCRAEYVKVHALYDHEGKPVSKGVSQHDGVTVYEVGKIVRADKYDGDIRVECTSGIHFYLSRDEAKAY